MKTFRVYEAINKLAKKELAYIVMINMKTLENKLCLNVSDMATFRASFGNDVEFAYVYFDSFSEYENGLEPVIEKWREKND